MVTRLDLGPHVLAPGGCLLGRSARGVRCFGQEAVQEVLLGVVAAMENNFFVFFVYYIFNLIFFLKP